MIKVAETISKVKNVFDEIKSESTKNGKIEIIRKYIGTDIERHFTLFLHMLLDDKFVCGIKKRKFDKVVDNYLDIEHIPLKFDCLTSALESLYMRESANEQEIFNFISFLYTNNIYGCAYLDFVRDVICKDFKCGIGDKLVNEAFGYNVIDNFMPMKGKSYDPNKHLMNGEWFALTEKIDGLRAMIVTDNECNCKIISSSGKEIKGLEHLYIKESGIVLDGELYVDYMDDRIANFREVQSVVSSSSHPNKHLVKFKCFDGMTYNEFVERKCETPYKVRRALITNIVNEFDNDNIVLVYPLYIGNDKIVIDEYKTLAIESGWEGIIINLFNAPYEFKRTNSILKVKDFKDAEFLVIDMYEGEGKNVGKLGGLVIAFDGNTVNVGGGFSDAQRELFWNKPETILRKMITVNYMDEFIDVTGNKSLRHPGFKGIREEGY